MNKHDEFELIRDEPLIQIQRRVGLAPKNGLGIIRRSIFFSLLCWLPIFVWAILNDRLTVGQSNEPFLNQFSIHAFCLIAIPCLILSEAYALKIVNQILEQFISGEIIKPEEITEFNATLKNMSQLRDRSFPWIIIFGLTLTLIFGIPKEHLFQELDWATTQNQIQFGGWWYLYVARTIFFILLLGWFWRLCLLVILFRQISNLDLQLVGTHPDHFGGIGFILMLPKAFSLITLALSSVIAANWTHQAMFHQVAIKSFQVPLAIFIVIWFAILTLPICLFIPKLIAHKKNALAQYRALIGKHGRLVHQRWITGEKSMSSPILEASELGSIADIRVAYEAITKMKVIPVNLSSMIDVITAIAIPMILVASTQIPISQIIMTLMKAIV